MRDAESGFELRHTGSKILALHLDVTQPLCTADTSEASLVEREQDSLGSMLVAHFPPSLDIQEP